jgi:predicted transcriptional regulator
MDSTRPERNRLDTAVLDGALLTVLKAHGPLTLDALEAQTGAPSYTLNLALERLRRRGLAQRRGTTADRAGGWGGTRVRALWEAVPEAN